MWTWLTVLLCTCWALSPVAQNDDVQQQLAEANARFTYAGAPIHPLAVRDLLTHLLDPAPGPIAVDLAGTRKGSQIANRYWTHGGIETTSWGTISVSTGDISGGPRATFEYKRLGTLRSGTHVLETWSRPGGSGVFTDLLFVRFVVGDDYDGARPNTVERRTTLLMKRVGSYGLGDRYGGTIAIREDTVEVDAENDGGGAKVVLRIP